MVSDEWGEARWTEEIRNLNEVQLWNLLKLYGLKKKEESVSLVLGLECERHNDNR